MKKLVLFILIIVCIGSDLAEAFPAGIHSRYSPDCIHMQFAGNVGFGGLGLGYYSKRQIRYWGIGYGYLPGAIGDAEVHTISLKYARRFFRIRINEEICLTNYGGSNLNYALAHNTYLQYPGYFPKGYYPFPNSIRFAPFLGLKIQQLTRNLEKIQSINFHCELGTVDYEMWHAIESKSVHMYDVWNLAFGISVNLKR